jgi:hypothetical protein
MEEVMNDRTETFDLDELLHPASAFNHPSEVVKDPDLTLNEKRAILASWASDACAVEAAPELRTAKNGAVRFDDIMDALKQLDGDAVNSPGTGRLINRAARWKARHRGEPEGRRLFGFGTAMRKAGGLRCRS